MLPMYKLKVSSIICCIRYNLEFESHIKFKFLLETPQREIYWAFMKWDSFKLAEPRIDDRNHEWNRPDFRTN